MSNIKFSLGIYNKRFNCHGPDNKNQKCPANPSLPKNSILMPHYGNISTKTRHAASIRIQSAGGGRMRLGGIKGGGIPRSTPASTAYTYVWVDRGQGPRTWGDVSGSGAITSNALGDKLAAVVYDGNVWRSTDYGVSWTENTISPVAPKKWSSIASNGDGTKLYATVGKTPRNMGTSADIWRSSDSGGTWVSKDTPGGQNQAWLSVATNEDGSAVVACSTQTNTGVPAGGRIWRSLNSGVNWSDVTSGGSNTWRAVTSSYDGSPTANTKFAVTVYGGNIWTSANTGTTWVENTTSPGVTKNWWGIASNSTGSNLAAVVDGGNIWTSTDSGTNWVEQTGFVGSPTPNQDWRDITSNSTGSTLTAVVEGGNIWKSTDGGVTWVQDTSVGTTKDWSSVTSNHSGDRLAAAVYGGNLWTWPLVTTTPAFNCAPAPPYPMACIKPPRNTF
jgi:hypothetical protein